MDVPTALKTAISLLGNKVPFGPSLQRVEASLADRERHSISQDHDFSKNLDILRGCAADRTLLDDSIAQLERNEKDVLSEMMKFAVSALVKTGKYVPHVMNHDSRPIVSDSKQVVKKAEIGLESKVGTALKGIASEFRVDSRAEDSSDSSLFEILARDSSSQFLTVHYGSPISLRVSEKCVSVSSSGELKTSPAVGDAFVLVNADYRKDRQRVRFMDSVLLRTVEGRFLTIETNDSNHKISSGTKHTENCFVKLAVTEHPAEWVIMPTQFTGAAKLLWEGDVTASYEPKALVGEVKVMDAFVLVSKSNKKLLTLCDDVIAPKESRISKSSTWHLCLFNMPYVTDWILTRGLLSSYVDLVAGSFQNKYTPSLFKSIPSFFFNESSLLNSALPSLPSFASSTNRVAASASVFSLSSLPIEVQDSLLTEEILFALMGIQGKFILRVEKVDISSLVPVSFQIDSNQVDGSSAHLVKLILPATGYYASVSHYIDIHSRYEFGLTQHAFCAALQSLLKEFLVLVAQLEAQYRKEQLTLQRLYYYLQPSIATLSRIHKLLLQIQFPPSNSENVIIGGSLLNIMLTCMNGEGDRNGASLFRTLLVSSSKPYLFMLEKWIFEGQVIDPHEEFCIRQRHDLDRKNLATDFNNSYWEEQYQLVTAHIFVPLLGSASKMLLTGKYWNVVRDNQKEELDNLKRGDREKRQSLELSNSDILLTPLPFTTNPGEFAARIDVAYETASSKLLKLLMTDMQLVARLKSLKGYFFLEHGDFFIQFYDSAKPELEKPVADISISKLEALLDMAIRTSTSNDDIYHNDLHCHLQIFTLVQKLEMLNRPDSIKLANRKNSDFAKFMKGFDSITFDYSVKWPLSLVLSKKALTKYQLIFRHLFSIKHIESIIMESWMDLQILRELNLGPVFSPYFALRHQMLVFILAIQYFMMIEILEPNFENLVANLRKASTVDELMELHDGFLDKCLKETLLTNLNLLKCLTSILATCQLFAQNINRVLISARDRLNSLQAEEAAQAVSMQLSVKTKKLNVARRRQIRNEISSKNIGNSIKMYLASQSSLLAEDGDRFNSQLKEFTRLLTKSYDTHTERLFNCLNYNGFYSIANQ